MTRQTFIWTAMSTRIETRIAKANAAPSSAVKAVVWVMKPGPMAEVAIRNMAPRRAVLPWAEGGACRVAASTSVVLSSIAAPNCRAPRVLTAGGAT